MNKKIYKVTQTQLSSLQSNGFITVDGVRYDYDPNSLYILADPFAPEYRLETQGHNLHLVKDNVIINDLTVPFAKASVYASNAKNLQNKTGSKAYTYYDILPRVDYKDFLLIKDLPMEGILCGISRNGYFYKIREEDTHHDIPFTLFCQTVDGYYSLSTSEITTPIEGYTILNYFNEAKFIPYGTVTKVNGTAPDSNGNVQLNIPTVNNGLLTIQRNGANVATFHANQSGDTTANITVPTKTSELTNDSFVTVETTQNITGNKIFRGDYTYLETDTIRLGKTVYDRRNIGDAPQTLSFMDSARTTGGYFGTVIFSGAGDWLYGAHLKENFNIRASYKGDGLESDTYDPNLGYTHSYLNFLTDWNYGYGWNVLASKVTNATPAIIQIKFTTQLYTDVLRLILTGHNLKDPSGDYSGFLDDYTIEVCTDYANDTWVTVVNRTNASDNIGRGLIYGLHLSTYTKCYGIRLKVTKCHVTGKGYQFIKISSMQLRDYRPAFTVPDSVGAVSQLGGDVWGKLITHDNLETGHVFPHKDNYYNLGSSTNRYQGIFGMVFYENGQALSNKYLGKTAQAADSAKLNGQPSSHYLTSIKMNGITKTSTNSTVDLGNVCTYTNSVVENKLSVASKKMEEITWDDLKFLKDSGKLTPGMHYRITDYTATINPSMTVVQSAGHMFDIIVTADDEYTLNENATATQSSKDTYFKDCDLSSWRLKYCLDNDRSRFHWAADEKDGKGVIYWMEDEFHNQVPYDFKNIMFKRFKVNTVGSNSPVSFDTFFNGTGNLTITDCISPATSSRIADITRTTFIWCYTFCTFEGDDPSKPLDASLNLFPDGIAFQNPKTSVKLYAYDNIIEPLVSHQNITNPTKKANFQELNNIVFMKYDKDISVDTTNDFRVYGNRFSSGCQSITLGRKCYSNVFNGNNVGLMVGYGCAGNTFNSCGNSAIAYKCISNVFNDSFGYNLVFNNCRFNTFGMKCQHLELDELSYFNTFENDISYVRLVANATGSEPLQYVTVSTGVNGTGVGNGMLHLSQPRGLTHTVTYRSVQSETIDV